MTAHTNVGGAAGARGAPVLSPGTYNPNPPNSSMAGTLFKWTNYWHGWQPRWFLLDQGVLTYYKSREEVSQGCKGSVKISACEIVPSQLDSKRLDIIIPSEQHYYLKAASEMERQQWLVLLGSVKQASASVSTFSSGGLSQPSNMAMSSAPGAPVTATIIPTTATVNHNGGPASPPNSPTQLLANAVKMKKSELRLYCDMLKQQVHTIGTSAEFEEKSRAAEALQPSCDTLIHCLDALIKLVDEYSERSDNEDSINPTVASSTLTVITPASVRELRPPLLDFATTHGTVTGMVGSLEKQRRPPSVSSSSVVAGGARGPSKEHHVASRTAAGASVTSFVDKRDGTLPDGAPALAGIFQLDRNGNAHGVQSAPKRVDETEACGKETPDMACSDANANHATTENGSDSDEVDGGPATFFSAMPHSFRSLELPADKQIPLDEFLNCCRSLLPVFDVLGSTAFAPVKMDIQGNIDKLDKHRKESGCLTVQALVQRELDTNSVWAKGSATDALLWLKRALAFICGFLREACCKPGELDLVQCATQAYGDTLRRHHNFVVKGIFSVAVRALPYYSTFLKMMAPSIEAASHPRYEETLKRHGMEYTKQLHEIVTTIDVFYVRNDIVSPLNL